MKNPDLFSDSNEATYCPEDNKLRLYVGRVPRDEYEALRKEGWTSTPKQACDFVAVWTPSRRDTAESYAGVILDEDQGPEDRAADRAERFAGYLEKRLDEATGHADRYDATPAAHGHQNQARAERAAARHDRIAGRAVDSWGKAEYWQRRTAGVISHALYVAAPGVRMGRIKEIEAEIRKIEASYKDAHAAKVIRHACLLSIVEHAEGKREKLTAFPHWQYSISYIREADKLEEGAPLSGEQLRRCMVSAVFSGEHSGRWQELRKQAQSGQIEAAAVAREWLDAKGWEAPSPFDPTQSEWHRHLTLRLAYENQMLEAQGGRAAHVEMIPGGFLYGHQIHKVNKSPKTGRVVSVAVKGPRVVGWTYKAENVPGTDYALHSHDTERLPADAYRPPTEEELAAFLDEKKAVKAAAPKKESCPLINPTDEDAERLQALWNARALAEREASYKRQCYSGPVTDCPPQSVLRTTQANYSRNSQGTYCAAGTRDVYAGGIEGDCYYGAAAKQRAAHGKPVCKIRRTRGEGNTYGASRVIIITDKPQKPLPAAVWIALAPAVEPADALAAA